MDDDGCGSGLSGWAFHELGRESERSHQNRMIAADAFAARLRGEAPVDVGALIAQNQALWRQNTELTRQHQALSADFEELRLDYLRLTEWAENAEASLVRLGANIVPRKDTSPEEA